METTRIAIDTDVLVDLLRNKKEAASFVSDLEKKGFLLATTAINAYELHYGVHKSRHPEKIMQSTKLLLSKLVLLSFNTRSAQKAGHIYAELERKGQQIGLRDTFIGAIALTKGFSVATRNVDHFTKIPDLKVISPE
jgi:tRNA(fMet)-specific endonuclease VapC